MKLLFDFFPILLFFIAYKFFGIYIATAVAMASSLIQVIYFWFKHHRIELTHAITLVLILILGGATLLSHNITFIKWKPTAIYWVFAIVFFSSQFIGEKPLIQRMLADKIQLPKNVWIKLNLFWVAFFSFIGTVNLYIAYHYSTNTWVNFKLFGVLGSTIIFGLLQAVYLASHLKATADENK